MSAQLQQAGQRGHGRAADAAEMDVAGRCSHLLTAGSMRLRRASLPAVNSACTPKVSVTFWRETWPLRRPMAIGPSKPESALRMACSRRSAEAPCPRTKTCPPPQQPKSACWGPRCRGAPAPGEVSIEHLAEDDAAEARELAGGAQLPQHAVNLIGLGANVLQEEQCAFGARLPERASSETKNAQASAIESSLYCFPRGAGFKTRRPWAAPTLYGSPASAARKLGR